MVNSEVADTHVPRETMAEVMITTTDANKMRTTANVAEANAEAVDVAPLHFVRKVGIQDHPFVLAMEVHKQPGSVQLEMLSLSWVPELHDQPGSVYLQALTATWPPESDAGPARKPFFATFTRVPYADGRGFSEFVLETSEALDVSVRVRVSRLSRL